MCLVTLVYIRPQVNLFFEKVINVHVAKEEVEVAKRVIERILFSITIS
jgi:hypothetical protein